MENYKGMKIALKVGDLKSVPLEELLNEVAIYQVLEELQGDCIPELLFFGYLEGLFCIGLSLFGSPPSVLTSTQKNQLWDSLNKIHQRGVSHGDIKLNNILLGEKDTPILTDFGFGKIQGSKTDFEKDIYDLRNL
jgi:serine/threonine protein kinase